MGGNILALTNLIKQTFRLDANQHRNAVIIIQHLAQARDKEGNLSNRTQTNTAELHRCARLQAANGVLKEHQEVNVIGIERVLNASLIVKETESGVLCDRLPQIQTFRHVKTHAAAKQRGQRAHLNAHACRRQIHRDPAVFPETDVAGDQPIVRRIDKELIADRAFLRIERAFLNGPDAIAAEQDRVARRKLARFFTVEDDADALGIRRRKRR